VYQLIELFITDIQANGRDCGIIPGHNYWVIKGNTKSKKKVPDACTLVDQLKTLGISEEEFINTYTERKYVTNLKKHHPRFRFETWSDLNLVTIIRREKDGNPYVPGSPKDQDQIIKNKNASRNARLLARRSTPTSKHSENSTGPSPHSTNDPSKHTLPNLPLGPEKNISALDVVPLREHLASCFKELGIKAVISIVEDLILFNADLYGKLDKLEQSNARTKHNALVQKHKIVISLLPEDADADGTIIQLPNPTDKVKRKTPALLSFGIDVNTTYPNMLTLTAAYRELGSFLMDRENKQSLVLPVWNGRNHIVVRPQKSQSVAAFVANATGSGWVEALLPDDVTREGMKKYLSQSDKTKPIVQMDTFKSEALASILNLTGRKLDDCRAFLRQEALSNSEHNKKEVAELEKGPEPRFGAPFNYIDDKGIVVEEEIKYWTTDPGEEACTLIQNHYSEMLDKADEAGTPLTFLPCLDYVAPGNPKGITVLAGGDHGDVAFRYHYKFHLSSPQMRKAIGDLSYQCPRVQCAFIACNADKYPILQKTIMLPLEEGRQWLTTSQAIVAYNKSNLHVNECYFIPEAVDRATFKICENGGGKEVKYELPIGAEDTLQLGEKFNDITTANIMLTLAVSKFNDLYLGDIKFFAYLLGMVNSDTCWCLHCQRVQGEFGVGQFDPNETRTKENLQDCLGKFRQIITDAQENNMKTTTKNYLGVNSCPLQSIDPDKLMISTLHCEIGQINKFNTDADKWVLLHVERLRPEQQVIRAELLQALKSLEEAKECWKQVRHEHREVKKRQTQLNTHLKSLPKRERWAIEYKRNAAEYKKELSDHAQSLKAWEKETQDDIKDARARLDVARKAYNEMQKDRKCEKGSYLNRKETIYRKNGMKHEHYHGGQFNGVSCRQQMSTAVQFCEDWQELTLYVWSQDQTNISEAEILQRMEKYKNLLGKLDVVYSTVRGVDGLLPTEAEVVRLAKVVLDAKTLWLDCGFNIKGNPKCHLIFDGHLVHQFRKYGGLADKNEDVIEFDHQIWKREKERTRTVKNFRTQQRCQVKKIRRTQHYKVRFIIQRFRRERKREKTPAQKALTSQKKTARAEAKHTKRELFTHS
jgi:tetratricopeptide (TPR) repeat protein